MRKLIITGMAVAMLAIPAAASANVAVDDSSVGIVGKGDVQGALGLANDAAIQQLFKSDGGNGIKFTNKFVATTDTTYGCSDGSTRHHYRSTIITTPVKTDAQTNNGGKVNGWTLNGTDGYGTVTEDNTGGTRFPDWNGTACPGMGVDMSKYNVAQSHKSALYVNGVELPNTPVVVPAA